jgi:transcriptional regulator with XRE-family HTH domain
VARSPIDGDALRWARELGRTRRDELARAVGVKADRIDEFESKDGQPTLQQLTLIATKFDRPLGFFFAPPPTEPDAPRTADFRGKALVVFRFRTQRSRTIEV